MFRLLSGHLQVIKIYQIKITMASSVVEGQIQICIEYWHVYCNTKGTNLNLTIQTRSCYCNFNPYPANVENMVSS